MTGEEHAWQKEEQVRTPRGKGTHAMFEAQQTSSVCNRKSQETQAQRQQGDRSWEVSRSITLSSSPQIPELCDPPAPKHEHLSEPQNKRPYSVD